MDLLRRLGYGELTHDSHVPFLSHLLGTRRLLVAWGERPALCDAGLFHSAYGTEYFQPDVPASRAEVQSLIGDDAEAVAWVWCTIRRDTLDVTEPFHAVDRDSGEPLALGAQMAADIATLWAADTVEQIARMAPDERGFAHGLDRVLPLASPAARAAADAVLPLIDAG
jgi:hypothetical protein